MIFRSMVYRLMVYRQRWVLPPSHPAFPTAMLPNEWASDGSHIVDASRFQRSSPKTTDYEFMSVRTSHVVAQFAPKNRLRQPRSPQASPRASVA